MQTFGAAGFHRPLETDIRQRLADEPGHPDDHPKRVGTGRVEVEHHMSGCPWLTGMDQGHVVLHCPLVGEPKQRAPVVTERA